MYVTININVCLIFYSRVELSCWYHKGWPHHSLVGALTLLTTSKEYRSTWVTVSIRFSYLMDAIYVSDSRWWDVLDRVWTSFTKNGRSTRTRKEANVVSELPSFIISIRYMGDRGWRNVKESPFYWLLRMWAAKLTKTGLSSFSTRLSVWQRISMIHLPQMFHRSLLRHVAKRLGKESLLRSRNQRI